MNLTLYHLKELEKLTVVAVNKEEKNMEKVVGENVGFERIRRITGYLVGTTDRFNNSKKAEEKDRVKHGLQGLMKDKKNED